jgi:hypothetical protein
MIDHCSGRCRSIAHHAAHDLLLMLGRTENEEGAECQQRYDNRKNESDHIGTN